MHISVTDPLIKMEIYNSRYFKINKTFMTIVGLWPYDGFLKKLYKRIILFIVLSAMLFPQLLSFKKYFGSDIDKLIEHLAVILYISVVCLKIFSSVFAESELKLLLETIASNWRIINNKQERLILMKYSERGRSLTIGYIAYLIIALSSFITLPIAPIILNEINPQNETRPRLFILNGEFLINKNNHYGKIYLFDCIVCSITSSIIATVDSMYTVCVEHCLALFAIVRFRLSMSLRSVDQNNDSELEKNDKSYHLIVKTIQLHNASLNFVNILESSYSLSYLFLMGFNMIIFSVTSVLILTKLGQIMEIIRFSLVLIGMLVHLFYNVWPGQKVIEHSGGLFQDAYTTEWYDTSSRAKKLLKFLILRCYKPCQLTAGGIYIMNFANFLSVLKTSISYITVFSSLR